MKSKLLTPKSLRTVCVLSVAGYLFLGLTPNQSAADVMSNQDYNIDTQNINIDSILHNTTPNTIIKPANPVQTKPKESYQIEPEFAKSSLSFSISQDTIDFGSISSTDPVIRNNKLSVSNTQGGYQIIAYENRQLTATTSASIPDTTCDNGSCSSSTPAEWTSALTYGFGYRCDNLQDTPCSQDFLQSDYYSPFANLKLQQDGVTLLQNLSPVQNDQAQITYKAIISGTQQLTNYTNTLTYIAVPGF